jgi:hypothetical protein
MKTCLSLLGCVALAAGCALRHDVMTATATCVGMQVAENPATDLYEVKFGYGRAEVALVPGNTNDPSSVADVVLEYRMNNNFFQGNSYVYQRLAVGKTAVSQAGAAILFAKDANGSLGTNFVLVAMPGGVTNVIRVP